MGKTFKAQVREMFNWPGLVKDVDRSEAFMPEFDRVEKQTYIGTVFSIMPSGKYYVPFACSNVTAKEADRDERFRAALEAVAESYGLFVTSGEGDPCDMYVGKAFDRDEYFETCPECGKQEGYEVETKEKLIDEETAYKCDNCKHVYVVSHQLYHECEKEVHDELELVERE